MATERSEAAEVRVVAPSDDREPTAFAAETLHRGSDARGTLRARRAAWARTLRLMVLGALTAVLAAGIIDSLVSWKIGRTLSGAAKTAAQVAISTPLNAKNCGLTPCSIESAAEAAKGYLLNAGYTEASCIDPRNPTFSGVLVWEFACDGQGAQVSGLCDTGESRVCVKIDMTPVKIQPNGTVAGYTRATVQYPHVSIMALILKPLPKRLKPQMTKSVAGDALVRDSI